MNLFQNAFQDAADELKRRGLTEALTFHKVGWRAWLRSNRAKLLTGQDGDEGNEQSKLNKSKSKLILNVSTIKLYRRIPSDFYGLLPEFGNMKYIIFI